MAQIRTSLFGFLKKSLHRQLPGINILLWGSPGTGKTEFCKTLATQIGCNLYAVGETDDDGDEPSRRERLDVLRLTQSLLQYQDNSLLMFDEMDDLFERSGLHPALLPKYGGKGMYGMKVHESVVENRDTESGISIHYVNKDYDKGNIIFQAKCNVLPDDTADDVAKKVHELEYAHFPAVIKNLLN